MDQNDSQAPSLTAKECLTFAARFKLNKKEDENNEIEEIVEKLVRLLRLERCMNTQCGSLSEVSALIITKIDLSFAF